MALPLPVFVAGGWASTILPLPISGAGWQGFVALLVQVCFAEGWASMAPTLLAFVAGGWGFVAEPRPILRAGVWAGCTLPLGFLDAQLL